MHVGLCVLGFFRSSSSSSSSSSSDLQIFFFSSSSSVSKAVRSMELKSKSLVFLVDYLSTSAWNLSL